ncbi:MAG: hypothetical protein J5770_04985 [Bacteroidaceae bacterium]|nr:hypothetical protein [Bacteroidaceae bacterium]
MKRALLLMMIAMLLLTACQESKRERFEREAREFTAKNCPRAEWDDLIFLDSLVCPNDGSNTITYYYSIHSDSASMVEIVDKYDDLYTTLLGAVRNSVDLRHVKEEGLNIVYSYNNPDTGEEITTFTFTPEDYN